MLAACKTLEKQEQARVAAAASRATPARQRTDAPISSAASCPGCPESAHPRRLPQAALVSNSPGASSPINSMAEREIEEIEMGESQNWPSPRDLDDLMGDREVANLQKLLKANNQTSMQQWLQVDPSQGLTKDIEKRRQTYGRNAFDAKPPTSFFEFWWDAMHETARKSNFKRPSISGVSRSEWGVSVHIG